MTGTLLISLIALAACLIIGFVVWMVVFDRAGQRAMNTENREQEARGERRLPS